MNDEKILTEMQDYNLQDKVRLISFRTFNSKIFLWISILYTISFISSIVSLFIGEFKIENLLSLILPYLMLKGCWKTYKMAKGEREIDTSGLRLIRGVITFSLIMIGIAGFFLLLAALIAGFEFLLIVFPVALICLGYYIFNKTLTNIIYAFEEGNYNTDYYSGAVIFLYINIVILVIASIIIIAFDPSWLPEMTKDFADRFNYTDAERIFSLVNLAINISLYSLIAYLIIKFKNDLGKAFIYYNKDGMNVNNIDYKISNKILDSDLEIDDRRKYDE